jgi:signal transduction histidine kinase
MRSQRVLAQQASMLEEKLAQEQHLALLQRNFVSMASHEFRTPLTIIDGHAQRLIKLKDRVATDEISERAGKVRGAVLRITHLIDNLLNTSRLFDGGGRLYFRPEKIDLALLLHEVIQLHREIAPGSQIKEKWGTAPLHMMGDPKLLFQVFSNLLSNAIKYSPNGGLIEISAETHPQDVVVAIEDHGIGIPEKDLDQLFERYHRGSNVSGIVGTGVGLYLVKMVVDLHGGSVAVDSREGQGSRFTLRLPLKPPPPPSRGERTGHGRGGISRRDAAHGVGGEPRSDLIAIEAYDGAGAEPSTCRQQLFHLALRLLLSGCEVAR